MEYLDRANQKASKVNAMEEAMAYFEDAINLLDTMPETQENQPRRISLLVNQHDVFVFVYRLSEYFELLAQHKPMSIELDDPGLLGSFYTRKGYCEWIFGYTEKSIQTATKAAEICEAAGNDRMAASAYLVSQWGRMYRGDYHKAIALKEDVLRKNEQQFVPRLCVYTFSIASMAYSGLGRWDLAVEQNKEALKIAQEYADNSLISCANLYIASVYGRKWDLERCIEYGDIALQIAPTPFDKIQAQLLLAWAWCRTGETQRGIETLTVILQIQRTGRYRVAEINCVVALAEGYWLAGEYDKARQSFEEAVELAERCGYRHWLGVAQCGLGEIATETNPIQAAHHFDKSITVLKAIKAENELAVAYAGYGRFHKQQGNISEAREYLTKALEIFERLGTLIQPDKVSEELAGLAVG